MAILDININTSGAEKELDKLAKLQKDVQKGYDDINNKQRKSTQSQKEQNKATNEGANAYNKFNESGIAAHKAIDARATSTTALYKKIGAAIAAAFAINTIRNFINANEDLYDKQMDAEGKLLTALKGKEEQQIRLVKLAGELQAKTKFGDETTIEAMTRLRTMLGDNEEAITRLIPLVQDFSEVKGVDLASAADLIGKSVGTSANALGRYGVEIEGAVGSSERLQSAVDGLSKKFGGQAEAMAKVGSGGGITLANLYGDLREQLGKFTDSFWEPIENGLIGISRAVLNILPSNDKAIKSYANLKGELNNYDKNIIPLLSKYDDLKGKTSLNADEQTELKGIIEQVTKVLPSAVTEWDKYGNAISISTEAVQEHRNVLDAAVRLKEKEAIKERITMLDSEARAYSNTATKLAWVNAEHNYLQEQIKKTEKVMQNYSGISLEREQKKYDRLINSLSDTKAKQTELTLELHAQQAVVQGAVSNLQELRAKNEDITATLSKYNQILVTGSENMRLSNVARKEYSRLLAQIQLALQTQIFGNEKLQETETEAVEIITDAQKKRIALYEKLIKLRDAEKTNIALNADEEKELNEKLKQLEDERMQRKFAAQALAIEIMKEGNEKLLAEEVLRYEQEKWAMRDNREAKELIEIKHQQNMQKLSEQFLNERIENEAIAAENLIKSNETKRQKEIESIDKDYNLQKARLENYYNDIITSAEINGQETENIEAAKNAELLALEIEFEKKKIEIKKQSISENLTLSESEQQREIELLDEQMNALNIKLTEAQGKIKEQTKDKSLWQYLGLTDEEGVAATELLNTTIDAADQMAAAYLERMESILEMRNKMVDEGEQALERELQLNEQGFASNVKGKQAELEQLKKLRDKAAKDAEKAARVQNRIDTLTQISSLSTSAAKLFAAESGKGFIGIGLAIGAIAAMFTAFQKAKTTSAKYATFEKGGGGIVRGKRHYEGGEYINGVGELEDGEAFFVVSRKNTQKYEPLIRAINEGNNQKIMDYTLNKLPKMDGRLSERLLNKQLGKENQSREAMAKAIAMNLSNPDIIKHLKMINSTLQSGESITTVGERTIKRKGNVTTIIN